eukprot:scaffold2835_cov374-Prasinococcus_capsulatus_cf.AAC.5
MKVRMKREMPNAMVTVQTSSLLMFHLLRKPPSPSLLLLSSLFPPLLLLPSPVSSVVVVDELLSLRLLHCTEDTRPSAEAPLRLCLTPADALETHELCDWARWRGEPQLTVLRKLATAWWAAASLGAPKHRVVPPMASAYSGVPDESGRAWL